MQKLLLVLGVLLNYFLVNDQFFLSGNIRNAIFNPIKGPDRLMIFDYH